MNRSVLSRLLPVALLAAGLLVAVEPSVSAAFKHVVVGEAPPAFKLKDLGGKEVASGDLYGKGTVAVVFWATWSPRSADVLRDLEALRTELGPDTFSIVTLNCEHPAISAADRELIAGQAKQLGLTGPVLVDDGLIAFNDYGAVALPSTLVVGTDGKVAFALSGYPTTMRQDLSDGIRRAAGLPTEASEQVVAEYVPKNHALMYYNLGRRLAEKGQDEKAEGQFATAVEKDPDFKKVRVELGLLYKRTGRPERALEEFRRAKEIDPKDHEALYQVAAVTLLAKDFPGAEKLFAELHEEFPEREEIALGLAVAQKYQGRDADFAKTREAAAKLFPADPRYLYELGGVAEGQQDLALAAELYRRALEAGLTATN